MNRLPSYFMPLLVLLCGVAAAQLTLTVAVPEAVSPLLPDVGAPVRHPDPAQHQPLGSVAKVALFGQAVVADAAPPRAVVKASSAELVKTTLDLTLMGIFHHQDEPSYALIMRGKEPDLPFHPGDEITSGAFLHSIERDHVVLERGGRLETLYLELDKPAPVALRAQPQERPQAKPTEPVTPQSTTRYGEIRERLLKNPQDAINMAKVRPLLENGKMVGYRVNPGNGRNRQLLDELGFIPGDVVTAVNGVSVIDPTQIGAVMNALTTSGTVTVTLKRNGAEETLSVNF
ncbi:MAG: PDZ domain-containing protein [Gammaproteobacteria bacterium]|nr:PDZ domain-containing protein [Gammaproteobacteria bacterium]